MEGDHSVKPAKRKHSGDKHHDRKSRKRRTHDDDGSRKHKRRNVDDHKVQTVDDDPNDDDMWVEKNVDLEADHSLKIKSTAFSRPSDPPLPLASATKASLKRDEWMVLSPVSNDGGTHESSRIGALPADDSYTDGFGEASTSARTLSGGVDFFSSLGTDVKKHNSRSERVDPDKPVVSYKELNTSLKDGHSVDVDQPPPPPKTATPGGPGSQWRMMRLKRVYESAEEEGLPVEQVGIDRFGSLAAFEDAKEERRILDERENKRTGRGREIDRKGKPQDSDNGKRFMFTDIGGSGASSRSSSFRRPGAVGNSAPGTPPPNSGPPMNRRLDSLRTSSQAASPLAQSHTPIPSVMTPPASQKPPLSPGDLNRFQARALRARLLGDADADRLEREYEEEVRKANNSGNASVAKGVRTRVEVLPTLNIQGQLYDVGKGAVDERSLPGNRKTNEKFETRDSKSGDILRYNADDDTTTLGDMLRHERFGAGMADQKNLDAQFARAIMGDSKFQNDLDYIDDNADKLGRQKMRSDAMKRQFAIHDYKRTQQAMSSCPFCFGEDDSPPKAPVVAMGTRVFLSCTVNEELVKGHCLIVPIQHHLTMLEGDDDVWDEVRNFMKCLMRMFAEEDQGVVFYETVITLKWQKHTYIECVPLPWAQYEDIPAYFKESIMASEAEWSQHKKLIDFSSRPGGFRRAMVPNLPYFMVQFDHKGERGYGHVIEGSDGEADDEGGVDEGGKGGGDFPKYFAGEIIGNVLDIQPRLWRRPRRIEFRSNKERVTTFKKKYDKFDWTGMIGKS